MSIISNLKSMPKTMIALITMLTAAVIIPSVGFAWGPTRATYTIEAPASDNTFNSITNNPNYGDERNFVTIKDAANQNAGGWVDDIDVVNDKEYYVRMYVHNNAGDNLGKIAENVTANFNVPTFKAKRVQIDGYLHSSNATPNKVWDQAVFSGNSDFSIAYVPGSATYTNNVFTDGKPLGDTVISSGVKLGYDNYTDGEFDGKIPGCFQYSGFVIFKVKAVASDFNIQKTVRINGSADKTFKESVDVKAGDKVDYQIYFKNIGGTQLKDVVIKDILPKNVKYVDGTSKLYNSSTNGIKSIADGITKGGAIIGGYMPNGDAYLMFTAQVANSEDLACGVNTLTNVAKATTSNGSKEDTAIVTVTKVCETPPIVTPPVVPTPPVVTPPVVPTVTPEELPYTGPAEDIAAIFGISSLVTALGYFLASRRGLMVK